MHHGPKRRQETALSWIQPWNNLVHALGSLVPQRLGGVGQADNEAHFNDKWLVCKVFSFLCSNLLTCRKQHCVKDSLPAGVSLRFSCSRIWVIAVWKAVREAKQNMQSRAGGKGWAEKTETVRFQVLSVENRAERRNPNHVQSIRDSKEQARYPKK